MTIRTEFNREEINAIYHAKFEMAKYAENFKRIISQIEMPAADLDLLLDSYLTGSTFIREYLKYMVNDRFRDDVESDVDFFLNVDKTFNEKGLAKRLDIAFKKYIPEASMHIKEEDASVITTYRAITIPSNITRNRKYQIILNPLGEIQETLDTFDFSICTINYNHRNNILTIPKYAKISLLNNLLLPNSNEIKNSYDWKSFDWNLSGSGILKMEKDTTIPRLKKYLGRGFKLPPNQNIKYNIKKPDVENILEKFGFLKAHGLVATTPSVGPQTYYTPASSNAQPQIFPVGSGPVFKIERDLPIGHYVYVTYYDRTNSYYSNIPYTHPSQQGAWIVKGRGTQTLIIEESDLPNFQIDYSIGLGTYDIIEEEVQKNKLKIINSIKNIINSIKYISLKYTTTNITIP